MGVHDGHRDRLKSRFAEHGLESFNDINALELLLFYAIPRKDTNVMAHDLVDRFGSLSGVFDASLRELTGSSGDRREHSPAYKAGSSDDEKMPAVQGQ